MKFLTHEIFQLFMQRFHRLCFSLFVARSLTVDLLENCSLRRETTFSSVMYAFLFCFLLEVILFYMFWCFLGYHWTSLIKLVKRANCKQMWSNQGDRHPSITRLHKSVLCLSSRVCAQATFFQTRSTPRGTQFKRFWLRLPWMFSYLTKRKMWL